jgi:hypothetical protein
LAFAADAGAFATLGGEYVGVTGVGIAPAQVGVQVAGEHRVVGMVGAAEDEGAQRPELRLEAPLSSAIGVVWLETFRVGDLRRWWSAHMRRMTTLASSRFWRGGLLGGLVLDALAA